MKLTHLCAFADNYIWLLEDNKQVIIVDPGEATVVIDYLERNQLTPVALLITHHHDDHTGGISALCEHYPQLSVYGPQEAQKRGVTHIVSGGETLHIQHHAFEVIATPGHTLGHVSYYCRPYLFCGDVLFSAGCGRIFEGTPEQHYHSLMQYLNLPDNTLICPAHEYTLSNLTFAHHFVPNDITINQALAQVKSLRASHVATLPTTLKKEKEINLFLRCHEEALKTLLLNNRSATDLELFTFLRHKKDSF